MMNKAERGTVHSIFINFMDFFSTATLQYQISSVSLMYRNYLKKIILNFPENMVNVFVGLSCF
jgi:hypothetical protein